MKVTVPLIVLTLVAPYVTPLELFKVRFFGPLDVGHSVGVAPVDCAALPAYSNTPVAPYANVLDVPKANDAVPCIESVPLTVVVSDAIVVFVEVPDNVKLL